MTASFIIAENEFDDIDWVSDRIRPWFRLRMPDGGWAEWPLGVFLMSSPKRTLNPILGTKYNVRNIAAYDPTIILNEDKFIERKTVYAGTPYIEAVGDMIGEAGINGYQLEWSNDKLSTDREFEMGTSRIVAINALLKEINYNSLYVDEYGIFKSEKYISAARRQVDHFYKDDQYSVIAPGVVEELDTFNLPNVFVAVVSNPETGEIRSQIENDYPNSILSISRRGRRVVQVETVDNIANQAELDAYTERQLEESMQVYQNTTMQTAIMPMHGINDIIEFTFRGTGTYKYAESGWNLSMLAGAQMTHTIRRVVQA